MNWPQSSYSSSTNSSSFFGGNQQPSSSGYGTPGQQQPQQQQQGMYGGHQSGYGTPVGNNNGGSSLYSSAGGFQSTAPTGLQQQTFSTSSPQQHQQQQQQPQQQHMMGGGLHQQHLNQSNMQGVGYQPHLGNVNGMGSSYGQPQQGGQQMMMSAGSGYGQYQQQQQQQQPGYGSPAQAGGGPGMQGGGSGAPSTGVGRYLPGYLTASSLSGSPRQSTSTSSNHDGRLSPEQSHRDTGSTFGAGSSRLFASSTSSAGTAGRESPSRSPKQSLFSSSAYGSSRSLALTPATGSRPRRTSSNNLVRSSHDDYMEEDAPPVDTLDDFDNDAGVPYVSSPPPAPIAASSPSKRQIGLPGSNGHTSSPSSFGQQQMPNGQSSANGNSNNNYKLIVFGFPPNLQSSVLKEFASIAPLVYNSIQDPSPSSSSSASTSVHASDVPPTGSNWFTIAYDNDWAALRALRKNGDLIAGSAMIGVKWADSTKALDSGMDLIPSQQSQQQSTSNGNGGLPRSSTASNLGTPATILPASQAFLPKSNASGGAGGAAMRKSATLNRINEMGKIDPSIFKQPDSQQQQKQSGGVVGTLTNLIFGF